MPNNVRIWILRSTLAMCSFQVVPANAQHDHTSPYSGMQERTIKALSVEDVDGLLAGEGMSQALAAELNGYPGPKHVLELADDLDLTAGQQSRVRAIFDEMSTRARELGRVVVDLETDLDTEFASGRITADRLRDLVGRIEDTRADLRATHLEAHLQTTPVLTEEQRERYLHLRGYGHPSAG